MIKGIINSTIGLTSAYLLTIILHEITHYLMSIMLGYEATLYHNKVFTKTNGVINHEILIAGIAPLSSLLLGILAYQYSKVMKTNAQSLFVLWFGLAGIITFFGYLMIAPLIPIGDTGKVFSLLNIPMIVQIIVSLLSIASITLILIKSTTQFERYAIEEFGSIKRDRKRWSFSLILIPLFLSIFLITLFQFPIPHIVSILATVCAPFSIMAVYGTFIGNKQEVKRDLKGVSINKQVSIPLIILFVSIVILNRILVQGI